MSEKKTICIIHHATMQGGGSKSLLDLANMLKEEYRVVIGVPRSDSKMKEEFVELGFELFEFTTKIPTLMSFSGGPPLLSKSLIKTVLSIRTVNDFVDEIMSTKPDAIFFNSIVSIISAKYFPDNVKKFCIVRETLVNKITLRIYRNILERYFSGVCFIANSEISKLALQNVQTLEVPDSLPEAKEEKFPSYPPNVLNNRSFRILFLGGAQRIKGGSILLKSLDYIECDFTVTIAGEFPKSHYGLMWCLRHVTSLGYWLYLNRLNKLLSKQLSKYSIDMKGYCQDISTLIRECDVIVFPSTNVHQPRPCIEAGYYGKPAIISDFEETREFFRDNVNAFTFKVGDHKDLAKKITMLAKDSERYLILAKNNYDMSFKYHDYDRIKLDLVKFIKNNI